MTGMEAWSIVAPIISAHMNNIPQERGTGLNSLDEAYIMVFGALNEHDKRKKEEAKQCTKTNGH